MFWRGYFEKNNFLVLTDMNRLNDTLKELLQVNRVLLLPNFGQKCRKVEATKTRFQTDHLDPKKYVIKCNFKIKKMGSTNQIVKHGLKKRIELKLKIIINIRDY